MKLEDVGQVLTSDYLIRVQVQSFTWFLFLGRGASRLYLMQPRSNHKTRKYAWVANPFLVVLTV